jgi:hypothetical protein
MAANNNIIPQPQVINQNHVRVIWTEKQCLYLLNQRMSRNTEYWELESYNRTEFWASVATEINECFGTRYMAMQVKQKWKNLVREHLVSTFYVN